MNEIIEITPSRSRPHRGSVRVRSETCNQHGDIVQTFTARLVVPRRVASQSDISVAEPALSKSAKS
jgi:acyl dehydratase